MQTFSLLCFSSSNRVGGVAHDCVKTASKSLFPDYKAPICFRSGVFRKWVGVPIFGTNQFASFAFLVVSSSRRRQALVQPRLLKIFWVGSFDCSILCRVHLFNSGLLYQNGGTFGSYFGFLIFPSLSDYFPLKLIRTLASEK